MHRKDFTWARSLFPHAGKTVYFNTASFGPFASPVAEAIKANIDQRLDASRDDSLEAFATADELRNMYARMLKARKREIGLGFNTSHGINIAAYGLPLKPGDEVLVTDVEFPAVVYTWKEAARQRGLKLKFVRTVERRLDIQRLKRAIGKRTRVLAISWVQFFNGYRNDLAELAEICKRHNLFYVVDGIQGMGVEPINPGKLGIDIFSSGCQKWMLSPQGCGFFYLSDRIRDRLQVPGISWLSADWKVQFTDLFRYDLPLFDSARRFEQGYYVVLNLMGMKQAADLFLSLGISRIRKHNYALIDRLADYLNSEPFYTITSSMEPKHRSSIFTFTCRDYQRLHRKILKKGIILVQREGSIRVSVHLFNNEEDIDRLIDVLRAFAKRA